MGKMNISKFLESEGNEINFLGSHELKVKYSAQFMFDFCVQFPKCIKVLSHKYKYQGKKTKDNNDSFFI